MNRQREGDRGGAADEEAQEREDLAEATHGVYFAERGDGVKLFMATQADVRRIALSLPNVVEAATDFAFSVPVKGKPKGFAWVWNVRVAELRPLLVEAHRCMAEKAPRKRR